MFESFAVAPKIGCILLRHSVFWGGSLSLVSLVHWCPLVIDHGLVPSSVLWYNSGLNHLTAIWTLRTWAIWHRQWWILFLLVPWALTCVGLDILSSTPFGTDAYVYPVVKDSIPSQTTDLRSSDRTTLLHSFTSPTNGSRCSSHPINACAQSGIGGTSTLTVLL
jgi:hypothetical protein